jgi:hypothetical protein
MRGLQAMLSFLHWRCGHPVPMTQAWKAGHHAVFLQLVSKLVRASTGEVTPVYHMVALNSTSPVGFHHEKEAFWLRLL